MKKYYHNYNGVYHSYKKKNIWHSLINLSWEFKLIILVCVLGFIITSIQEKKITISFFSGYINYFKTISYYFNFGNQQMGASYLFGMQFFYMFLIQFWHYTLLSVGILAVIIKFLFGKY